MYVVYGESNMIECLHLLTVKAGKVHKSDGIYQRYQCRECGKIITGELIQEYPNHE